MLKLTISMPSATSGRSELDMRIKEKWYHGSSKKGEHVSMNLGLLTVNLLM